LFSNSEVRIVTLSFDLHTFRPYCAHCTCSPSV